VVTIRLVGRVSTRTAPTWLRQQSMELRAMQMGPLRGPMLLGTSKASPRLHRKCQRTIARRRRIRNSGEPPNVAA
jgi:hypothetical protein